MHKSRFAAALFATIAGIGLFASSAPAPAQAQNFGGNVLFNWQFENMPSSGLKDITFHETLNTTTAHVSGNYLAEQFNFAHQDQTSYLGLQPRPDLNGHQRLRGIFSSFIPGAHSSSANCVDGADGGPGVSCGIEFDGAYGNAYDLIVQSAGNDTWVGTAKDTVTGVTTSIGSFTAPTGSGNLTGNNVGFLENYDTVSCSTVPRLDAHVRPPTTTIGLTGTLDQPLEYGDCAGQANFSASTLSTGGLQIARGWSVGDEKPITQTPSPVPPEPVSPTQAGTVLGIWQLCLDVRASGTATGTPVIAWECTGNPNQHWTISTSNQLQSLGKCANVSGDGHTDGSPIELSDCTASGLQIWTLRADGSFLNPQSGKCLDVDHSGGRGSLVILYFCTGNSNQKWSVTL